MNTQHLTAALCINATHWQRQQKLHREGTVHWHYVQGLRDAYAAMLDLLQQEAAAEPEEIPTPGAGSIEEQWEHGITTVIGVVATRKRLCHQRSQLLTPICGERVAQIAAPCRELLQVQGQTHAWEAVLQLLQQHVAKGQTAGKQVQP